MTIQIVSNSKNKTGEENFKNKFMMKLIELINAENQNKYIEVLKVSYPLTTKNVFEHDCHFQLEITNDGVFNQYIIKNGVKIAKDKVKVNMKC